MTEPGFEPRSVCPALSTVLHRFYKERNKKGIKKGRQQKKERREMKNTLANLCELDDLGKTNTALYFLVLPSRQSTQNQYF